MRDTPPDQKEADDAPAGPRNPWVGWLVWAVLALVLYVLSTGPVWWLVRNGYLWKDVMLIYEPMNYVMVNYLGEDLMGLHYDYIH